MEDVDPDTLNSILNAVGEGITVQDIDGRLIWVNEMAAQQAGFESPEQMLAASPEEMMSRFRLFEGEGTVPMDPRHLPGRRALEGERPPEVLVRWVQQRSGAEHWSLVRATPVFDRAGNVLLAVNVFRDVTDRQLAIQGLQQSERRYARLYQEQAETARTLSEAFLPSRLPSVPGLGLEASFLAAADGIGGDFYDVVRLADGRCLLVIADVSGKGAKAAVLTAITRYSLRTLARTMVNPALLLEQLNEVLIEEFAEGRFCSMAVAEIQLCGPGARVTVAVAGHPPPLVVGAGGSVCSHGTTGLPLGAFAPLSLVEDHLSLEVGDTLVMFTDGCVGEGADATALLGPGLTGLSRAPLSQVTGAVMSLNIEVQKQHPDDRAVLAARIVPPSGG